MKEIENAEDLAAMWTSDKLINQEKLDDPAVVELLIDIFKGTPYEIEEE